MQICVHACEIRRKLCFQLLFQEISHGNAQDLTLICDFNTNEEVRSITKYHKKNHFLVGEGSSSITIYEVTNKKIEMRNIKRLTANDETIKCISYIKKN